MSFMRYVIILMLLAVPAIAAEEAPVDEAAIMAKADKSVVIVEYTLKTDKGEARGWGWQRNADRLLKEERPLEIEGFLLQPDLVTTLLVEVHPRFVKKIQVRHGSDVVDAEITGYSTEYGTILYKLAKPLPGTVPLEFDAGAEPYYDLFYNLGGTGWVASLSGYSATLNVTENGKRYYDRGNCGLVLAEDGTPVALTLAQNLPVDDSWKGSPLAWKTIGKDGISKMLESLHSQLDKNVLRVRLNFRSPNKSANPYQRYYYEEDEENATELNVVGMLVAPQRLLVMANLKPKVTSRLEKITVFLDDGTAVKAEFEASLKEYGAFLAKTEKPLPQPIQYSSEAITDVDEKLLLSAEVNIQGEQRVLYYEVANITDYYLGMKRRVLPYVNEDFEDHFFFDLDGRLLAFPIEIREKATVEEQWSSSESSLLPVVYIQQTLQDIPNSIDPANVPLTEEEENRIAWLGVELQALNRDLAQLSKVSHLTNDGETGAIVSYVYPDSPAAKADVKPGDILIRLHVEGEPKPLEVELDEYVFAEQGFPWAQYDQITEQYYDQIPQPWPTVNNSLNEKLTAIGFGKKLTADFFRDGKLIKKEFTITESPKYYASAARCKIDELGLTVRNMTYEARRYFQKKDDDPGVIASKVEQGSKASIGGLKPYEIITHVNGEPVMNVDDFEKLVKENSVLRLSVKRMNNGRVVQIIKEKKNEPTAEQPTEAPAVGQPAK